VRGLEDAPQNTLVIKFGGTSVGSGEAFGRAAAIAAGAAQGGRPVAVVVSAMSGTTDALLRFVSGGDGGVDGLCDALTDRHLEAAREAVSAGLLPLVEERLRALIGAFPDLVRAPYPSAAARRDAVSSFGERLSSVVLAGAMSSAGVPASVVAQDPIATDAHFGEAEVDVEETRLRCSRYVAPMLEAGTVAVVPGFVGRTPEGAVTTLGRGGSDLSATVVGRGLGASEVWIMTDVDGVLDADPRLVPDAALMPELSYREATLFATLGAKVLHRRTMEPASEAGTEVFVRNTFRPGAPGTRVTNREEGRGLRCVALRHDVPVEVPCGNGHRSRAASVVCIGTPEKGDLKRGIRLMKKARIPMLHAGKAKAGLVFFVSAEHAERALRALHAGLIPRPEARAMGVGEVA
jgi:aspartate kinase